jgi:outer membrane autotransporter protein
MTKISDSGDSKTTSKILTAIQAVANAPASQTELAFKQLIGESVVNVPLAISTTVLKAQGVVFNRLDRIRQVELGTLTPPAAGQGDALNRVWVGGFGVWADADNKNNVFGYDYNAAGVALGYDRKFDGLPGLLLGVSAAFSNGELSNNNGLSETDIDTYGFGVYGSYILPNGLFFDANVGFNSANNDYTERLVIGGTKSGAFDVNSWQLGARFGYVHKINNFQLIPSLGIRYFTLRQKRWVESLDAAAIAAGAEALWYAETTDNQFDIPLQLKINGTFEAGSAVVTPELRLGYTVVAKKTDNVANVGFVGNNTTYELSGLKPQRNTFQVGAGVKINTASVVDIFVNYDLDIGNGYKNHNASLGVGFDF